MPKVEVVSNENGPNLGRGARKVFMASYRGPLFPATDV